MSITGKQVADAMGGGSIVGNDELAALLNANFAQSVGGAAKVVGGVGTLDGGNPTNVVTGLTAVGSFVVSLKNNSAPGVGTSLLTYGPASGGTVPVYAWKPTSNTDPTLIASAGTEDFSWVATGT